MVILEELGSVPLPQNRPCYSLAFQVMQDWVQLTGGTQQFTGYRASAVNKGKTSAIYF